MGNNYLEAGSECFKEHNENKTKTLAINKCYGGF
jgi:hypothetical protein